MRWLRNGIWATEQNYAGAQIECAHGADNVWPGRVSLWFCWRYWC